MSVYGLCSRIGTETKPWSSTYTYSYINPSKKDMKNCSIEEILKQPSHPLELVTTKVGGMKAAFEDFCYEFHYHRSGNKL